MLKNEIKEVIDKILKADKSSFTTGNLLAFRPKKNTTDNKLLSLNYEIYDTCFEKDNVVKNVKILLTYFKFHNLNEESALECYSPTNSKDLIDYLKLSNYDFNDESISSGKSKSIDNPATYKIEWLLKCLNETKAKAKSEKDYEGLRYCAFSLMSNEFGSIYIINKSNPLYKPKDILYTFDLDNTSDDSSQITNKEVITNKKAITSKEDISQLKEEKLKFFPFTKPILRLPSFPSIVILNGYCFFVSDKIESVFGFESYNKIVCQKIINDIIKTCNLDSSSTNLLNKLSNQQKNFNLFADFENTNLDKIKSKDPETLKILKDDLGISIDSNLNLSFTSKDEVENFIYFITNHMMLTINSNDKSNKKDFVYTRNYKKLKLPTKELLNDRVERKNNIKKKNFKKIEVSINRCFYFLQQNITSSNPSINSYSLLLLAYKFFFEIITTSLTPLSMYLPFP